MDTKSKDTYEGAAVILPIGACANTKPFAGIAKGNGEEIYMVNFTRDGIETGGCCGHFTKEEVAAFVKIKQAVDSAGIYIKN